MTIQELLTIPPEDTLRYLFDTFSEEMPETIITPEDATDAANLLIRLSSEFSFLCECASNVKLAVRKAKRDGDKSAYEDMVDRKEVIERCLDSVKQKYAAVSRALTVKIENNRELHMNQA